MLIFGNMVLPDGNTRGAGWPPGDERGVTFVDVDFRWGIPDEQRAESQPLPICLAEIENCRPFFIGLVRQAQPETGIIRRGSPG